MLTDRGDRATIYQCSLTQFVCKATVSHTIDWPCLQHAYLVRAAIAWDVWCKEYSEADTLDPWDGNLNTH